MYGKMQEYLRQTLAEIKEAGLYKEERLIESAQQAAHALGMRVMVGCMTETSCAISAASQFSPLVDFADLDGNLLISNDRFKGVEVVKGKITLNDLPGIGVMKI